MTRKMALCMTLVVASGCAERIELDSARVCLSDPGAFGTPQVTEIAEGELLTVFVEASAGCHTEDLEVRCTATVDGDTVWVTTETTWRRVEPLAMSCESVLYVVQATCETDQPLEAGSYTLVLADQEQPFTVPSSGDAYDCL